MIERYEAIYVSGEKHSLSIRLKSTGLVRFKNGIFKTEDKNVIDELDDLLKNNISIARFISKVNREAAEKLALEHKKKFSTPTTKKGTFTSVDAVSEKHAKLSLIERQLRQLAGNQNEMDNIINQAETAGLTLTQDQTLIQDQIHTIPTEDSRPKTTLNKLKKINIP